MGINERKVINGIKKGETGCGENEIFSILLMRKWGGEGKGREEGKKDVYSNKILQYFISFIPLQHKCEIL